MLEFALEIARDAGTPFRIQRHVRSVGLGFVAEPAVGAFLGLDVCEAVELGELLGFLSDWLASDSNRLDASLYEFVDVSTDVGPVCGVDELRTDLSRFAGMLLGDGPR